MTAPNGNGTARLNLGVSTVVAAVAILSSVGGIFWRANSAYEKAIAIEERLSRAETMGRENRTLIAVQDVKLTEIDTQLRASIDDRNLTHAWDLRMTSMLWAKAFPGSHFPTDNVVYPNIADGKSQ